MNGAVDRLAGALADRLMTWIATRVDPDRREWVDAMIAESLTCNDGTQRLRWAVGGLQLLWTFRRARPRAAALAISGSSMMNAPTSDRDSFASSQDYFAVLTTFLLAAVVLGYSIFLMPVFAAMMQWADRSLALGGIDFGAWGIRIAQFAPIAFVIGSILVLRLPKAQRRARTRTMVGGMNALLGVSAVMLGVTLFPFAIHFPRAMIEAQQMRGRERQALYDLSLLTTSTPGTQLTDSVMFSALARVAREALRADDVGPVAINLSGRLDALTPKFEKNSALASDVESAHLLAGRVAMITGQSTIALKHLRAAAAVREGAPRITAPNMRLARDLLERDVRPEVVSYLKSVRATWLDGAQQLDEWTSQIQKSGTARFGRNLMN